jgi:SAM-dependent methyltransferase/uncharacterized protein YbaR (Trm112 family)
MLARMMPPMEPPREHALRDLLACPRCHGKLVDRGQELACSACDGVYRIDDGIPIFAHEDSIAHDELDHVAGGHGASPPDRHRHKAGQIAWFDRDLQAEFEIERPTGAPAFYRFLLREKFRRAIEPVGGSRLEGRTALAVCGGSGMDAEFLADAGAAVISSDISLGAARRARERALRHGVAIVSIVADVELLPFRDGAVDIVYVHDGLHHLVDPDRGLREMMRVAARWVSITEPAQAAVTRIAIKLGLAKSREESGNLVARLEPAVVGRRLHEAGFSVVRSERYAMYYPHSPGRVFAFMSRPWIFPIATSGWRLANAAIGRAGNKLAIIAERRGRR